MKLDTFVMFVLLNLYTVFHLDICAASSSSSHVVSTQPHVGAYPQDVIDLLLNRTETMDNYIATLEQNFNSKMATMELKLNASTEVIANLTVVLDKEKALRVQQQRDNEKLNHLVQNLSMKCDAAISKLQHNLTKIESDISVNQQMIGSVNVNMSSVGANVSINKLKKEIDKNTAELSTVQANFKDVESRINKFIVSNVHEMSNMYTYLARLGGNVTSFHQDIITFNASLSSLQDNVSNSEAMLRTEFAKHASELNILNNTVDRTEAEITTLNNTAIRNKVELTTLISTLARTKGDITTLNISVARNEGKLTTINDTVARNVATLTTLNDTVAQNIAQLTTLNNNVTGHEADITTLKHTVASNVAEFTTLNNTVSKIETDVTSNQQDIRTISADLSALQSNVSSNEIDIGVLAMNQITDMSSLHNNLTQVEGAIAAQQRNIITIVTDISKISANLSRTEAELQKNILQHIKDVSALRNNATNIKGDLNVFQAQIASVGSDLSVLRAGLNKNQSEIRTKVLTMQHNTTQLLADTKSNQNNIVSAVSEITKLQVNMTKNNAEYLRKTAINAADILAVKLNVSKNEINTSTNQGQISNIQDSISKILSSIFNYQREIGENRRDIAASQAEMVNNTALLSSFVTKLSSNDAHIIELQRQRSEQSGFTVCIPSQDSSSDIIKFNSVISNIGNHFNANTGQFRCQYPGMYFFSLSLYKNSRADSAQCWIRKNGANVIYAYSDPNMNADRGNYEAGSTAVMHLDVGDLVNVGGCTAIDTITLETTFSGFLLQRD